MIICSSIEFGPVVLEKKFKKKKSVYFLVFRNYLPLKKGVTLHLNKTESPPSKDNLCQDWLKLAQWFWRRSWKCKSLQTDNGQQVIGIAHLSFQLMWAKHYKRAEKLSRGIWNWAKSVEG
jgi:hypothetical protein